MKYRTVLLLTIAMVAGAIVAAAGVRLINRPYSFQGSLIDPPLTAADFELVDQHGRGFQMGEQRGKVILIFFGYTHCPDVCPATLAHFKRIKEGLGEQGEQVQFVFITVDPDRDTPARMAEHLSKFDPSFIGLTGDLETLARVWGDYYVFREEAEHAAEDDHDASDGHYLVDHTSRVYLVDQAGGLRLTFPFGVDAEAMLLDVRHILTEGRP